MLPSGSKEKIDAIMLALSPLLFVVSVIELATIIDDKKFVLLT
jgi:hypothetical protein